MDMALEAKFTGQLFKFLILWLLHLNLYFIADTKLVFDLKRGAYAAEVTTMSHNAKPCRQCLSFIHRVRCQEDS